MGVKGCKEGPGRTRRDKYCKEEAQRKRNKPNSDIQWCKAPTYRVQEGCFADKCDEAASNSFSPSSEPNSDAMASSARSRRQLDSRILDQN